MAKESAVLLVIASVLLILGAIALINLERPPVARRSEPATAIPASENTASKSPAPPQSPAPSDSQETAEPAAEPSAPVTEPVAPLPTIQPAVEPLTVPVTSSDIEMLRARNLLVPVAGVSANQLRDTFGDGRSEGRMHEALDIIAPVGTPVVAVADGTLMKLFQSVKGGITIYQADPGGKYVYYYAHLLRYADGVIEGKPVKRGEIIGYVGDTGNAGAGNYHLHFAILKPAAPGKWSGGTPINPYHVIGK